MMVERLWYLEKYHRDTYRLIAVRPPEPIRFFWLARNARREADRLNRSMVACRLPQRYRVRKVVRS